MRISNQSARRLLLLPVMLSLLIPVVVLLVSLVRQFKKREGERAKGSNRAEDTAISS